ncbi:MAG TPA: tannase/feruloyl esterase family alpha/beta hydrolase [Vicinamibacterales bacterium]|nr:tannase/feruloyl esterase family alpha/beta hydrolase [Vicinamibacterales bacterium]
MKRSLFASVAAAFLAVSGAAPALGATDHAECSHLVMLKLPDVKLTEATAVPAAASGAIRVAHCRVNGTIGSEIHFTLLMPDDWNRKFMMGGGGGFVGQIQNQAGASVNDGYATVGTDTGHQAGITDGKWALNNPERLVNFGHLAVHRTAEVAKAIVRSYYGATEAKSYFSGCSNGGRQALMEAQRYPEDFDGIIAGAPAYDFTAIAAQFIKEMQAVFPDPRNLSARLFTVETMKSVEAQLIAKCDALDGVKDGLIEDPRACKVDIGSLTGLSEAQKTALKTIYGETRNKDGVIYPAQPVGGEGEAVNGWAQWIVGGTAGLPGQNAPSARFAFGTEIFKYMVFNDPSWDYTRYEFSNYKKDTALAASALNATNTDLDAFKARGGKLILWHGWSDPALTALGSIRYYEGVQAHDGKSADYFRMFMMPGVLHCAGGPGPDTADWTAAISDWVEHGKAPERVVAKKTSAGAVTRTRPLCAYPQKAVYKGSGSTDEAENFACK